MMCYTGDWSCGKGQTCTIHEDGRLVWSNGVETRVSLVHTGTSQRLVYHDDGEQGARSYQQATLENGRLCWDDGEIWSRSNQDEATTPPRKVLDGRLLGLDYVPSPFFNAERATNEEPISMDLVISVVNAATAGVTKLGEEVLALRADVDGLLASTASLETLHAAVGGLSRDLERLRGARDESSQLRTQIRNIFETMDEGFTDLRNEIDTKCESIARGRSAMCGPAGGTEQHLANFDSRPQQQDLDAQVRLLTQDVNDAAPATNLALLGGEFERRLELQTHSADESMRLLREQQEAFEQRIRDIENSSREQPPHATAVRTSEASEAVHERGASDRRRLPSPSHSPVAIAQIEKTLDLQNSTLRALEDTYTHTVDGLRREIQTLTTMVCKLYESGTPASA